MQFLSPPLPRQPTPILYHYSSREALLGITETRSLWASNIRFLNDSAEFTAATKIANAVLGLFIDDAANAGEKKALEGFRPWLTSLSDQVQCYVFSLSEDGDSLSQWRGYCQPGNGYAIGFLSQRLIELAQSQPNSENFFLQPCRYIESEQKLLMEWVFSEGLLSFRAALKHVGEVVANQNFMATCILRFILVAPLVKNSHFHEEKEWRLVAPLSGHLSPDLSFRPGKSFLVPYIPFQLGKGALPINEVVIGPGPHNSLDSTSVLNLLTRRKALGSSCRNSIIPFRDW